MATFFIKRIKAAQMAKNKKVNTPFFKTIMAKSTQKKVVLPQSQTAVNPNSSLLTQKPSQDCCCIRRQMNRANMLRFKRQLLEQNLNQ